MFNSDFVYKIAFASVRGMGYDLAQKILEVISSEEDFFNLSEKSLQELMCNKSNITTTEYRRATLEKAKKELDFIERNNIGVIYFSDKEYPQRLTYASDAPIILYTKGNCNLNSAKIISIVGTRHATPQGKLFCESFIQDLSELTGNDTIIVSGLAYGIDICAHNASLKYGLPTIGVLAHGLNTIYPATHRDTAVKMVKNGGMLLTDYMSSDKIHPGNFVARNRIVAALSDCTLVIESAEKGGSLITANIASSYSRDVFAVPGRYNDEFSKGCNKIIKNNSASLVTCAQDLVDAMNWEIKEKKATELELFAPLSESQIAITDFLRSNGESHINVIASNLSIPISRLMSDLIDLEFNNLIIALPGTKYALK